METVTLSLTAAIKNYGEIQEGKHALETYPDEMLKHYFPNMRLADALSWFDQELEYAAKAVSEALNSESFELDPRD